MLLIVEYSTFAVADSNYQAYLTSLTDLHRKSQWLSSMKLLVSVAGCRRLTEILAESAQS